MNLLDPKPTIPSAASRGCSSRLGPPIAIFAHRTILTCAWNTRIDPPLIDTKDAEFTRLGYARSMNKNREKRILEERLERCRRLAKEFPNDLTAEHLRQIEVALGDDIRALEQH